MHLVLQEGSCPNINALLTDQLKGLKQRLDIVDYQPCWDGVPSGSTPVQCVALKADGVIVARGYNEIKHWAEEFHKERIAAKHTRQLQGNSQVGPQQLVSATN